MARCRSRTPIGLRIHTSGSNRGDIRLHAQTPKGNTISLDVHKDHTIDWVTARIEVKELIPPDHHLFVKLEGARTLSDYNLPNGCRVYMMKTSFRIKVKPVTSHGEIFTLEVEASDTIGDVKAKIKKITRLPPRTQSLGFQRKEQLVDGLTLSDYTIKSLSLVRLTWTGEGQDSMDADDN